MIRNSVAYHHSGNPNVEAVAEEVTWNVCRGPDLLKTVRGQSALKGLLILEQEQGTWNVAPAHEICQHRVGCIEWGPAKTNVDKGAFPKRSVFKPLICKHMHEGADGESTAMFCTPK